MDLYQSTCIHPHLGNDNLHQENLAADCIQFKETRFNFPKPLSNVLGAIDIDKSQISSTNTYIEILKDDKYLASITSRSLLWNLFPNTYKNSSLSVSLSLSDSYLSISPLPPHMDVSFGLIGHLAFQIC